MGFPRCLMHQSVKRPTLIQNGIEAHLAMDEKWVAAYGTIHIVVCSVHKQLYESELKHVKLATWPRSNLPYYFCHLGVASPTREGQSGRAWSFSTFA